MVLKDHALHHICIITMFHAFRCVFTLLQCCMLVGLGWAEPMMYLYLHVTCSCISCICTFKFLYLLYCVVGTFLIVSLSPFISLSCISCFMATKRKSTPSQNPLRSGASSSFDPTPSSVWFHDERAHKDFSENFSKQGIHSERQVILSDFSVADLPTVIYSRGWESLCGAPITCPSVIIQEFYSNMHGFDSSVPQFSTRVRGTSIMVTPNIIFEVLHVPTVVHPDYPDSDRLRTMSKDKLMSLFSKTLSSWGDRQNTHCSTFAKSLRFLNMVMTFILHPQSHYNTITKPDAHFLLSLIEDLSIDFPSHFIFILIDVYRDMVTRDQLVFPSTITRILHHFLSLFLHPVTSLSWVPLTQLLLDGMMLSFTRGGRRPR